MLSFLILVTVLAVIAFGFAPKITLLLFKIRDFIFSDPGILLVPIWFRHRESKSFQSVDEPVASYSTLIKSKRCALVKYSIDSSEGCRFTGYSLGSKEINKPLMRRRLDTYLRKFE